MSGALRDLFRPPFRALLLLNLFLYIVAGAVPGGDLLDLLLALAATAASVYVEVALTLAAGSPDPGRSGDVWFRAAVGRRCFWRVVGAQLATVVLVAAGALLLVVGAIVMGGVVSLAEAAAVLERAGPIAAVRRSALLGRPARRSLALVFALLVLVPSLANQAAFLIEVPAAVLVAVSLPLVTLTMAGNIALARAFVALGGAHAPSLGDLRSPGLVA
jgi:hypothetical protein